jgi:5'-AMP-activated protein kinase regulatory beta subunit
MTSKRKRVAFTVSAPKAKKVLLAGTFNLWSDSADPMKREKSGPWKKIKMLPPGTYEYKFIVDGEWTLDPDCPNTVFNQHGTLNNVIAIGK